MKTYFVTGATGAVGSALVPLLLEDPESRVVLLIRASSEQQLAERMESLYRFWEINEEDQDPRIRVTALRGDITEVRFGLDDRTYQRLADDCTHIVHAAGNVRMNLPIEEARRSSVGSAKQIVALARACPQLQKVEFVSTVGVGGRMSAVPERWITEPREFHNTYEQAKAEAEDYLREQIEAYRLPITVLRPSMVVGDSVTGKIIHFQVFYYLCEFLSGRLTARMVPNLRGVRLDIVHVDHVARALAWSSRTGSTTGKVLHLCSGPELSIELTWLINKLYHKYAAVVPDHKRPIRVPTALFQASLPILRWSAERRGIKALGVLPVFFDYASQHQEFECAATQHLLTAHLIGASVTLPNVDVVIERYLERAD